VMLFRESGIRYWWRRSTLVGGLKDAGRFVKVYTG